MRLATTDRAWSMFETIVPRPPAAALLLLLLPPLLFPLELFWLLPDDPERAASPILPLAVLKSKIVYTFFRNASPSNQSYAGGELCVCVCVCVSEREREREEGGREGKRERGREGGRERSENKRKRRENERNTIVDRKEEVSTERQLYSS